MKATGKDTFQRLRLKEFFSARCIHKVMRDNDREKISSHLRKKSREKGPRDQPQLAKVCT